MELRPDREFAEALDDEDPLRHYRDRFRFPRRASGEPVIYLCGNSLGLQPDTVRQAVAQELDDWEALAVHAHFKAKTPWYSYHEVLRESGARLVGARPGEVVIMNGLTTNLHLMMVTFYEPTADRFKIVVEDTAFPSDTYAVKSQLRFHGHDPQAGLITLEPRPDEHAVRTEDIETLLAERGAEIALVMLGGVNYFTGQLFDMERITRAARQQGCRVGFDLAHAAGNVVLELHDWDVDFAVWCTYKYLNGGPGSVAGCFVHEQHGTNPALNRFAGWWGNDPEERFQMHLLPDFEPRPGADGWQLSNPPILAMAPVKASLDIFDEVGMPALRKKSEKLTGYLLGLIDRIPGDRYEILTPRDPAARGCQLSIRVKENARRLLDGLEERDVVCDFRAPDVIRVAPVPLYNSFQDVWEFARILERVPDTE